jgi:hypothetical protein
MLRIAEDIVDFANTNNVKDPVEFTKRRFNPRFDTSTLRNGDGKVKSKIIKINYNLFYQIDDYIQSKAKQVSPKMLNVFRNMRDTLKAFEDFRKKPITFESFDYSFYEEFVEYMKYDHVLRRRKELIKGFRVSSIGKTIKQLRIFLNNRIRKKIIAPIDLQDYKILDEASDAIYLTWEEINRIYRTDLSERPHLVKYRDLFVFGCLTGLRFSDFSNIQNEDVRNGMLYKKQKKSDQWVVIPLRKEAEYIFTLTFNKAIPPITNPDFNYYIKEVGMIARISQLIKFSHKKGNKDMVSPNQNMLGLPLIRVDDHFVRMNS